MAKVKRKLAVFDLDSTLLDGESINIVLNQILKDPKQKQALEEIRAKGMRGEIDLETSLKQRIALFKGLKLDKLETICQSIPWTRGAKETISQLKEQAYFTICLSSGFRTVTRRVISELGIDTYCCNTLQHQNNTLTGLISGELMHHQSKGKVLHKIQKELGISSSNTIVIADGANDLSMFKHAEAKIAFSAQDVLKKQTSHHIETKDLRDIFTCL